MLGWSQRNLNKIEFASTLFPLNRSIALGPAYFYLAKNDPSEKALNYINAGLIYDPNAVDLLKAKITHSLMLGKQKDATEAYNRLSILAPKR